MKQLRAMLVVGAYVGALLWAYAAIISPAFSYEGYRLVWPNAWIMTWLIVLALAPALFLPYTLSRPSALIVWWLYLAAYIPSILVPALSLSMPVEKLVPLHVSLLASMGILCLVGSARPLAIGQITLSPTLFWPAFVLLWLACLGFACMYGSSNVLGNLASVLNGATEYDIRSEYVAERSSLLGYVVGELGQALNPFLIALGITRRRPLYLAAGIAGQAIIFGVTGFKSVLFSALFLPMVLLFLRRSRRSFGFALTSGLIAVILVCALADQISGNVFLTSLITRRTLAGPGLLTGFYFEHFSQVSHVGIGYHFHHDASVLESSREIGFAYFGSSDTDANANLWAQGFADLGIPGILGFTCIVALMLWLYDSIAARRNLELAVLLAAMPAMALSNSAPTTVLITHGGLVIAMLLLLAPSAISSEEPEAGSKSWTHLAEASV